MKLLLCGLLALLCSWVVACGGHKAYAPGPATVADGAQASASSRSAEPSGYPAAPALEAQSRPGLGTEWGETRYSPTHSVRFERASQDAPDATITFRYNDREGIQRLDGRRTAAEQEALGVSITIQSTDSTLDAYRVGGDTYVVGERGERYVIAATNHTSRRFEIVASVDGIDVISGRDASYARRGYVLEPHATVTIDGFRLRESDVAAFRFSRVSESYAAETGRPRNVGVIGIALFGDADDDGPRRRDQRLRESAQPFPASGPYARPPRR